MMKEMIENNKLNLKREEGEEIPEIRREEAAAPSGKRLEKRDRPQNKLNSAAREGEETKKKPPKTPKSREQFKGKRGKS